MTKDKIINAYEKHGSCAKAAKHLKTYPQKVHRYLISVDYDMSKNKSIPLSKTEKEKIILHYKTRNKRGELNIKKLANEMERGVTTIVMFASSVGLTKYNRDLCEDMKNNISVKAKKWIKDKGHPKGFLGGKHTQETKDKISKSSTYYASIRTEEEKSDMALKAQKTRVKNGTKHKARGNWRAEWATINRKKSFYRSRWELNYAYYLEFLRKQGCIKKWEHEPKTFWFEKIKRGVRSYLPDFRVTHLSGKIEYHEVKGWMDQRSKTKIKRFAKYYPEEILIVVQAKEYNEIRKKVAPSIDKWRD